MAIVAFQVVDEGIHILVLLLLLLDRLLRSGDGVRLLLVKLPALDVGRQRRNSST